MFCNGNLSIGCYCKQYKNLLKVTVRRLVLSLEYVEGIAFPVLLLLRFLLDNIIRPTFVLCFSMASKIEEFVTAPS